MLKTPILNHHMTLQVVPVSTFAFSYREGKLVPEGLYFAKIFPG